MGHMRGRERNAKSSKTKLRVLRRWLTSRQPAKNCMVTGKGRRYAFATFATFATFAAFAVTAVAFFNVVYLVESATPPTPSA